MNLVITFAIPTYNRAKKLDNLLSQLANMEVPADIISQGIEILVSNNASEDATNEIVSKHQAVLKRKGYFFSYAKRERNLGLDGNMLACYLDAKGEYVWYFSDDDILIEAQFLEVIKDIQKYKPDICLSNFEQGKYNASNLLFDIPESYIETDPLQAMNYLLKFPKLTIYIVKRISIEQELPKLKTFLGSYYLFIALFMLVFAKQKKSLLMRKPIIARAEGDFLGIRYSPRVFANREKVASDILLYLGYPELSKKFVFSEKLAAFWSFYFVALYYLGKANISKKLLDAEKNYLRKNFKNLLLLPFSIEFYRKVFGK